MSTDYRDALGALVTYADIALADKSRLPRSAPSDPAGSPVYAVGDRAATAAGQVAELAALTAILTKLGSKLSVSIDGDSVVLTLPPGLATAAGQQQVVAQLAAILARLGQAITVQTPAGGPLATREQPGFAPTQTPVPVPAFAPGNVAGVGGANATVVLVATITSGAAFLSIDNTGPADAELWFGARPADAAVGLSPGRGKPLPAGGGVFFDVRVPTGPIYATAKAATGLSVLSGA